MTLNLSKITQCGNFRILREINFGEKKNSILISRKICDRNTVWKFYDFSVTQILRGINFGDSTSAKNAVFTILRALNCGN